VDFSVVVDEAILRSVSDELVFSTWMIGQRTDDWNIFFCIWISSVLAELCFSL